MMKVAQGWVINWWPPQRLPASGEHARAAGEPHLASATMSASHASSSGGGNHLLPALSQVVSDDELVSGSGGPLSPTVASYSVEFREKGSSWQTLAGKSRERSLLLKDLKPGSEYLFRVFAHAPSGVRGSPTPEFRYLIPDNRRKPGSTQALSAGVVSGVLFFIACIVIAVCAVNMCNKRRKKRAEKGEFVG